MLLNLSRIYWTVALSFLVSINASFAGSEIALAGNDTSVCAASAKLSGNTPLVLTGLWTVISGSGILDDATNPLALVSDLSLGDNLLVWEFYDGLTLESSDSVLITVSSPPTITAGPDQTICADQTTLEGSTSFGTTLWTILNGTSTITDPQNPSSAISALSAGENTFLFTVSSPGCPDQQDTVAITVSSQPTITAGLDQTICANSTILEGSTSFGTALWTNLNGTSTITDPSSPTSAISALSAGENTLLFTVSSPGCPDQQDTVAITVSSPPTITAGPDQTICSSETTLEGSTSSGTALWTILNGSATITDPSSPTSALSALSAGENTFLLTVSSPGCPDQQDTVVITVSSPPTITAGPDQTICADQTTLEGSTNFGTTQWTILNGTSTITDPQNPTSAISALSAGENTFLLTVSSPGCPDQQDTVAITVSSPPTITAGLDQTICADQTTLEGSTNFGTTLWTILNGTATITDPSSPTSAISALSAGENTFLLTVSSPGCPDQQDTVAITVSTPPTITAGPDQTICADQTILEGSTSFGTTLWTILNGSATIADPSNPTSALSALSAGENTFLFTVSSPGCPDQQDTIVITVSSPPTITAGPDQTICDDSTTLEGSTSFGTALWTILNGSATITDPSSPTSAISALYAGENTFLFTVSSPGCPDQQDTVAITVSSPPTITAGPDQTICADQTTLEGSTSFGTTLWTILNGSATITDPSSPTSAISALSAGENTLLFTVSSPGCPDQQDTVAITVSSPPTITAGPDQTICSSETTLEGSTSFGTALWAILNGTATITDPSSPTSALSALSAGENTILFTVSSPGCPDQQDTVVITVASPPTITVGPDQTICSNSTILEGSTSFGTILWTILNGSATITDPSSPTSAISALSAGENTILLTVSSSGCPDHQDTVAITVSSPPTITAGPDQTICSSETTLAGSTTFGTTLWTILNGSATITDPSNPTSAISALSAGENTFLLTVSSPGCPDQQDTVVITVSSPPTITAGPDQTICSDQTTLEGSTTFGTTLWTVLNGSSTFTDPSNPTSAISALSAGENTFLLTVSSSGCPDLQDTVVITVSSTPTVSNAGPEQSICSSSTTLQANTPLSGSGSWSVISGSGTFIDSTNPVSIVSGLSIGNNTLRWTISNGICTPSFSDVFIFVDSSPIQPYAGDDQVTCSSSTIMSASPNAGTWSVVSGSGTFTNINLGNSLISGLSSGQNVFRWTVNGGACGNVFDEITITVQQNPTIANAGSDQEVCATLAILEANSPSIGNGLWTLVSGSGTFENSLLPNTSVSGLSVGVNKFRWTISNGTCTPSQDDVIIIVQSNPLSPNAGQDQTICSNSTFLSAAASAGGLWTRTSGSGTIITPTAANSQVTGLLPGTSTFRWTIPGGSCADVFDEVSINVQENPSVSDAGLDQQICSTVAQLQGNNPSVGAGLWTLISGNAVFANASNPITTASGLSIGNNVFRWTITNGVCPSSFSDVLIVVESNAVSPNAGLDQTICSSSTQLSATIAAGGFWTRTSGSGTIVSASASNTQITGLTSGQSVFRWTIPGGSCGNVFDEVLITVDEIPSTSNPGNSQQICATSADLSANIPLVGNGIWTVVSGSGNFNNAASASTSVSGLAIGENIFAWTISNGVCPSSSANTSIIVDQLPSNPNAGPNQTICSAGTQLAASPAIGGTWTKISGSGTITSPTLFNSTVTGLIAGTSVFRWTVSGGTCPSVFAEVSIIVQSPPTTALAGSDQNICSTTTVLGANLPIIGNGFWTLVSGSGIFDDPTSTTSSLSGLSVGNNTFRWTITNGVCAASTDDVTITVQSNPLSPNAGTDQTICSSSTTLGATATVGGLWSIISGSGTFTNSSLANTSVSGLSIGVNVFRWTIPGGACPAVFDEVSISVQAAPTISSAGNDQTICSTTAVLQANTPIVGLGIWSVISGVGSLENSGSPNSSVTALSVGNNTFRWTISNGVCPSSSDDITITVQPNPVTPNAGTDQTICSSSTTLAAVPTSGGFWSLISGAGTIANASLANTSIYGLAAGVNVFRWTIPGGACPAVYDEVSITVQTTPTTSSAGNDQTICSTTAVLQANTPVIGIGIWSVISGAGTLENSGSPNSSATGLSVGVNTFRWTISNGVCPSSSDEITITVQPNPVTPNAGTDQTICSSSTTLSATATSGGIWSLISGSGTFANSSLANTSVSGLSTGLNVFRWTIPGGACPAVFDDVSITVQTTPTTSSAGNDQTICSTTTSLAGNVPTTGTGLWTVISGTANFANASLATTSVSGLSTGLNTLRWTISNGVCPSSSDEITITVQPNPVTPNAGTDQTICSSSTTLSATATSGGIWSLISGSGTFANSSLANTSVSGLSTGLNVFRWTIPGGACPAVFDDVSITVQTAPTTSSAGNDQTICSTTTSLAGNVPATGTGLWTVISGTATFVNANSPTSSVSGLAVGNNTLRWTISNGVCPSSSDEITITVQPNPVTPNAGTDQTICSSSTTLAATATSGGIWSLISGSGTFANSSLANTSVSGLSTGVNVFRWTIPGGACPAVFDEVSITVQAAPTISSAGNDQSICSTTTILQANTPSIGSGLWSVVNGSGTFANAALSGTSVSALSTGINTLRWTISNGVCANSSDDVIITVQPNPITPNAGPDQIICTNNANLAAITATGGVWTIVSGGGSIANPNQANSDVSGLSTGLHVFRWTIPGGVCPTVFDDVSITVLASPTVANAGMDQSICATSTTLAGNSPSQGSGLWTVVSGTGVFSNATQSSSAVSSMSAGPNVFRWTISNGVCPPSTDDVVVTVQQTPLATNAGVDQVICGSSTSLAATAPSIGIGTWSLVSGTGTFSSPNSFNTSVFGIGAGVNVYRWTVANSSCASVFDEVSVQSFVAPSTASAGFDQSICGTTVNLSASNPNIGIGTWSLVSGNGIIQQPNQNQTQVTNVQSGTNVFRYTVSNGVCPPSVDEVTIQVFTAPIANAGLDQSVCNTSATLNGNASGTSTGTWTLVSGNGVIQSPNSESTQISNLGVGPNVFQWTLNNGVCLSVSDQVTITRFVDPTTSVAGFDLQTCANSAQLNANVPSVGQGFWSVVSGSGNFSNPTSPTASVSGLSSGLNVLRWSISNGNCPTSSSTINITVDQDPTSANAGSDQSICSTSSVFEAEAPSAGTGFWTLVSGTGTIASSQSATSGVSAIGVGINVFRWTVINGACVSFDEVTITRALPPSVSNAGPDQQICSSTATLSGNIPSIGVGSWSIISGSSILTNQGSANSAVSNLSVGANVFTWTISNGACPIQEDQITIIRQEAPTTANAGPDQIICSTQTTLAANLPLVGNGIWSVVSGTGTLANAQSPVGVVTALNPGPNVFQWTTLNGVCPTSTDQVTITRVQTPSVAAAGADASVCGSNYQLQAQAPLIGTGLWTFTAGSGTLANPSSASSSISALSTGIVQLTWTVSNAPCPASSDVVVLNVSTAPPIAFAGVDLEICGDSTFLAGNAAGSSVPLWSFITGSGNIDTPGAALTSVTELSEGVSSLEYRISNGNCISRDTIKILNYSPVLSAFAGFDTTICTDIYTLNAEIPIVGNGVWNLISGDAGIDENENANSLAIIEIGSASLEWIVSNGVCPTVSDTVEITRAEAPEQAVAMNDLQICNNLVSLSANTPSVGLGYWDVISANAEVLDPTNANTQLIFTEENEVILQWVIQLGECTTSDTVTISRPEAPYPVYAGDDQTLCIKEAILEAEPLEVGTGVWTSLDGGFFSSSSDPTSEFVVPDPGIRQLVWTATNGSCIVSDTVAIEFLEQPNANAGPNLIGCAGDSTYFQAEIPETGDAYWVLLSQGAVLFDSFSQNAGFVAETPGNYYLLWYVENESCRDSALLTVTVYGKNDPKCQGEIVEVFIPEGFSPNGDGVYDKFVIAAPSSKAIDLKVFDRWGAQVFESTNYQNDWEGTSTLGTLVNGNQLPEGTYYYLVQIKGDQEVRKGYFTLWR